MRTIQNVVQSILFQDMAHLWLLGVFAVVGVILLFAYCLRRWRIVRVVPGFRRHAVSTPAECVAGGALLVALLVAYAGWLGPRQQTQEEVPVLEGLTIVASMDCSRSTLAAMSMDDPRSRFAVMRDSVQTTFEALPHDRKGFICFAGTSKNLTIRPTTDYRRIIAPKLRNLTRAYIQEVGRTGTNFAAALDGCFSLFDMEDPRRKVCVILSDGERQGNVEKLRRDLNERMTIINHLTRMNEAEISYYLVGVGDPKNAMAIPEYNGFGNLDGFVCCTDAGENVRTRPDPKFLNAIAKEVGGSFRHISDAEELRDALTNIIRLERKTVRTYTRTVQKDLSPWFLGVIAICLAIWFVRPRRLNPLGRKWRK